MNGAQDATIIDLLDRMTRALETIATNTTKRPRRASGAPVVDARQLPLPSTDTAPQPITLAPLRYRWGFNTAALAKLDADAAAALRAIHPTALAFGTLSGSSSAWWFVDPWTEDTPTGARLLDWCKTHRVSVLPRLHRDADDEALRGLKRWTIEDAFAECARVLATNAEHNDGATRKRRERKVKATP